MSTLAETISNALAAAGPATETRLHDIQAELAGLNFGAEDHLSVLATAIAAATVTHHARHKSVYLEAVRTWALEISIGLAPPPARPTSHAGEGPVEDGADILISGLDALLDGMASAGVKVHDRLVMELALFARLLGQYDANAIHLTLMAVATTLAQEGYRPGQTVRVPLGDRAIPLGRDACLDSLAPRGIA